MRRSAPVSMYVCVCESLLKIKLADSKPKYKSADLHRNKAEVGHKSKLRQTVK